MTVVQEKPRNRKKNKNEFGHYLSRFQGLVVEATKKKIIIRKEKKSDYDTHRLANVKQHASRETKNWRRKSLTAAAI